MHVHGPGKMIPEMLNEITLFGSFFCFDEVGKICIVKLGVLRPEICNFDVHITPQTRRFVVRNDLS